MRRTFIVGLFLTLTLSAGVAVAQQNPSEYDIRTLTTLYEAYLKRDTNDAYIEKRIADERLRLRTQADTEVRTLVEPASGTPVASDGTLLPSAINAQRTLVEKLQQFLQGLTVDLDLFRAEERRYYIAPQTGTGSSDALRLTVSHGELLAKTAVLEERIQAFEAGLSLQKDRLSKLNRTQWYEQFSSLFGFLTYVLLILVTIVLDRMIRRTLVGRIQRKNRRFLVAKIVTAGLYGLTIFWILSRVVSEHPNVLASLAIIGAGIAVALQDIVKDFVGWLLILQRGLFTLGDRVSVGAVTGDIIDIGPLRTTMLEVATSGVLSAAHERTGKTLHIPNSLLLREPVINFNATSDFMSVEIQVSVTHASDWKKAESLLQNILSEEAGAFTEQARKQQRRHTVLFYTVWEVTEPEVHVDIVNHGILFTLKFIVPIGKRRSVVTSLSRAILEALQLDPSIQLVQIPAVTPPPV